MDWPLLRGGARYITGTRDQATSQSVQLPATGVANTKGPWTEVCANVTMRCHALSIVFGTFGTDNTNYLIDIGVADQGSPSNENIIIPNLLLGNGLAENNGWHVVFLVDIPAGKRLMARHQSTAAADTCRIAVDPISHGWHAPRSPSKILAWGLDASVTGGTQVPPPGVANTKGNWVQLKDATEAPVKRLWLAFGDNKTARATRHLLFDIAIEGPGSPSSTAIIIPDLMVKIDNTQDMQSPGIIGPLDVQIPAGVKLMARCQCDQTSGATLDVAAYGGVL